MKIEDLKAGDILYALTIALQEVSHVDQVNTKVMIVERQGKLGMVHCTEYWGGEAVHWYEFFDPEKPLNLFATQQEATERMLQDEIEKAQAALERLLALQRGETVKPLH